MKTNLPHSTSDFSVEDEQKVTRRFKTLSKEEIEVRMAASTELLEAALEAGRKEAEAARKAFKAPKIDRNLRFT